ncbi:MAG: UPF0175 family protein [Blastocatellia bacterium]
MEIQLTIPDEIAAELQNGSNTSLSRRLLELVAIKLYEADLVTSRQVQEMLGFESREELFAFFKAHDVRDHHFTMEELERGRATLAALLDK